jgi:hypothetical protein
MPRTGGSLASFGKPQLEAASNFRHDAHPFMQAKMIPDAISNRVESRADWLELQIATQIIGKRSN